MTAGYSTMKHTRTCQLAMCMQETTGERSSSSKSKTSMCLQNCSSYTGLQGLLTDNSRVTGITNLTQVGLQGLLTGKPWPHQVEGRLPVRLLRATFSTSRLGKACAWLPHAPGRLPFSRLSVSPSVRSCGRELEVDQYVGNVPTNQSIYEFTFLVFRPQNKYRKYMWDVNLRKYL